MCGHPMLAGRAACLVNDLSSFLISPKLTQTLSVDAETICGKIKKLDKLLNTDSTRVNAFFRKHLSPIVCTPEKENGQRFYRARGAARDQELLALFGIETPFAFRGCGGSILSLFYPHHSHSPDS